MDCHEQNAREIARFLSRHPKVRKTYYTGLPDHPQHDLARSQMTGSGAMISFDLCSFEWAKDLLTRVQLCYLGESLGEVETLNSHPATMTHGSIPESDREKLDITMGLVRISVGIEDVEDLVAHLEGELKSA